MAGVKIGSRQRLAHYLRLVVASMSMLGAGVAFADAGWFESGDARLRTDLQLLNDAEIIRLPISHWPLPRAAVRHALGNAKEHLATNAAVMAALERVRARALPPEAWRVSAYAGGGDPGLLRDFDALGRDDGEIGLRAGYSNERFEMSLNAAGLIDPADGKEARLDGSHATVRLGNWLLSLHSLERWWGPGHEGSLILSNNARPMPTLMVERAAPKPFENRWLSWLGPWRFSFGISQMEEERADIDRPLFMAWRVSIMPLKDVEIGFSRTAQFCGEQLECSLDVFGNMIAGNDNVGIDATPENEPGNQMAGFDLRWSSPIGNWPYAIYGQYIGEDESGYLPVKYLGQLGLETWKPFADGAVLQTFAEYANTTCSGMSGSGPYYDCAYRQGRFNVEGYRYRGRVIGHTADADAETYAIGTSYSAASGSLWSATARAARLNRDGIQGGNTVSAGASDYAALELGWRGSLWGGQLSVDLGVEKFEGDEEDRNAAPFGFIGWRHDFSF